MPPTEFLISWFITWVILAVVFLVAADQIQRYLYETVVERMAWRVMAVTPLLAAVLVRWPLPFQDLFFNMFNALSQAVLWFLACWLCLRFQWQHAAAAGLLAVVTIAPITSSTIDRIAAHLGPGTRPAPASSLSAPQPPAPAAGPSAATPPSTAASKN